MARAELLRVKDVEKVDLIGLQPEKIFIEMSDAKLASFGIDPQLMVNTLQQQNVMTSAGDVITKSDRVFVRVTGDLQTLDSIKSIGIRANNRVFRLGDVAKVWRGYADPPTVRMHIQGEQAIGIAVSMQPGGNILALGKRLDNAWKKLEHDFPIGVDFKQVSNQPKVVKNSVNEFLETLVLALVIVLGVGFISLGWRSGTVVALCIPLVLAGVFGVMNLIGIDFEKISLGALIIALGLLVDDAIIGHVLAPCAFGRYGPWRGRAGGGRSHCGGAGRPYHPRLHRPVERRTRPSVRADRQGHQGRRLRAGHPDRPRRA
jgi:multidrug efflux pump